MKNRPEVETFDEVFLDNDNMDWSLLREQKQTLLELCANGAITEQQKEHLEGLINLIDTIQDLYVDNYGGPEEKVFNLSSEK